MRTLYGQFVRPVALALGIVTVCFTTEASGQGSGSGSSPARPRQAAASAQRKPVKATEKAARAQWQPVRPTGEAAGTTASQRRSTPTQPIATRRVELVQGDADGPRGVVRTSGQATSILEGPIRDEHVVDGGVYHEYPADGQVMLSPIHDGGASCDGLPGGSCGCSDGSCDGMCNSCGPAGCGELTGNNAWRPCATLCLPTDGWFSAEYLGWWQDGMSLPPLVTTNLGSNIARGDAGVIGRGSTQTLFGGDDVLTDSFSGGRYRFGVWLDKCHTWGIGGEYFQLGQESEGFSGTSTGSPILARPFFNTARGVNDAELVAFPGVVSGSVTANAQSELQGWGVNVRRLRCADEGCSQGLFCGCPEHFCRRTEHTFGYRGLQLDEQVAISERLVGSDGEQFAIDDVFQTRNQFNGVDLGWTQRMVRGYWTLDTGLRLALGNNKQTVTIAGNTVITDPTATPAGPRTFNGGLLAQRTNIGTYERNEFAVVPELNATLGYQLTDHLRATVGYTFIYWSNVVRPGDQIDSDLNPALLPPEATPFTGANRPGFDFDTTDYWVQGISIGGEYRW